MNRPPLLDTNVLIYTFEESDPQKCKIARRLLEEGWEGKKLWAVTTQNLIEFFLVGTRKLKRPLHQEEALQVVNDMCASPKWLVLEPERDTMEYATELSKIHKLSFLDAILVAIMLENQIFTIYTEDKVFSRVPGIKVINPFT